MTETKTNKVKWQRQRQWERQWQRQRQTNTNYRGKNNEKDNDRDKDKQRQMTEAKTMRKTMTDKEKQRQITVIHSSAFMLIRSKSKPLTFSNMEYEPLNDPRHVPNQYKTWLSNRKWSNEVIKVDPKHGGCPVTILHNTTTTYTNTYTIELWNYRTIEIW